MLSADWCIECVFTCVERRRMHGMCVYMACVCIESTASTTAKSFFFCRLLHMDYGRRWTYVILVCFVVRVVVEHAHTHDSYLRSNPMQVELRCSLPLSSGKRGVGRLYREHSPAIDQAALR